MYLNENGRNISLPPIPRNILLNPGPATTTDTVKYAQVVPDICPREQEFRGVMQEIRRDLLRIVHADPSRFSAVLFCGSGTLNIEACVTSLVPADKKVLICSNGSYSARAAEIARVCHVDHIELKLPTDRPADPGVIRNALERNPDIAAVYCCMHETGTGILNPVSEIGAAAHQYGAVMITDTTSAYAMIPIHMEPDNLDFVMASAQKGLMAMTGLSFVIGRTAVLEASRNYPTHSYYSNLYLQYQYFRDHGEMRFTPPVQTIYAARQAIREYFEEGESAKWRRHSEVWAALWEGAEARGFQMAYPKEYMSRLVVPVLYPETKEGCAPFDFDRFHDALYARGFTIYPGKVAGTPMFRLCSLGTLTAADIASFYEAIDAVMQELNIVL